MQLLKFDLVLVTASLLVAYNKLYQSSVASINTWTTACFIKANFTSSLFLKFLSDPSLENVLTPSFSALIACNSCRLKHNIITK